MANRSAGAVLNDSAGAAINALDKTADFYSEKLAASGDWFGLGVYVSNAGGTSMTCDCKVEASPDDFTTTFPLPAAHNSATQAALTQFASIDDSTDQEYRYWVNPYAHLAGWKLRVFFDHGGTVGTNTFTAWYTTRNTSEEVR